MATKGKTSRAKARPNITVNKLIKQLQKIADEGRGHQPVFISMDGHRWCPRFAQVEMFHSPQNGHIVLSGEAWSHSDSEVSDK